MQKEFDVYVRKIVTELNSKNEPISKGVKKVFLGKFKADYRNEAIQKAALQSGYSMNCDFRAYEKITEKEIEVLKSSLQTFNW